MKILVKASLLGATASLAACGGGSSGGSFGLDFGDVDFSEVTVPNAATEGQDELEPDEPSSPPPSPPGSPPPPPPEPVQQAGDELPQGFQSGESPSLTGTTVNNALLRVPESVTIRLAGGEDLLFDGFGQTDRGFNRSATEEGALLVSRVGLNTLGTNLESSVYGIWLQRDPEDEDRFVEGGAFFGGLNTPFAELPTLGQGTYSGDTIAVVSGADSALIGGFEAVADFSAGTVNGDVNFPQTLRLSFDAAINENGGYGGATEVTGAPTPDLFAVGDTGRVVGRFTGEGGEETAGFYTVEVEDGRQLRGSYGATQTDLTEPVSPPPVSPPVADLDGDGVPDSEDDDIDGDGVLNADDQDDSDPSIPGDTTPVTPPVVPPPPPEEVEPLTPDGTATTAALSGGAVSASLADGFGVDRGDLQLRFETFGTTDRGFNRAATDDEGAVLVSRDGQPTNGVSLDYTRFGMWFEYDDDNDLIDGGTFYRVQEAATEVPASGTAVYRGAAAAAVEGVSLGLVGTFEATADFGADTIEGSIGYGNAPLEVGLDGTIGGDGLSGTATVTAASGAVAGAAGGTGTFDGRFAGPAAAELGGLFTTGGGGALTVRGSFGAERGEIVPPADGLPTLPEPPDATPATP